MSKQELIKSIEDFISEEYKVLIDRVEHYKDLYQSYKDMYNSATSYYNNWQSLKEKYDNVLIDAEHYQSQYLAYKKMYEDEQVKNKTLNSLYEISIAERIELNDNVTELQNDVNDLQADLAEVSEANALNSSLYSLYFKEYFKLKCKGENNIIK